MRPQETNSVGHLETGWAGHDCPGLSCKIWFLTPFSKLTPLLENKSEFSKVIDSILIKIFWNMQFESKRLVVRAPRCVVQLYIFSNYIHTCAVHTCQQLISRLELLLTWSSVYPGSRPTVQVYIYLVQRHTGYICLSDIFEGVWNVYKRCRWCVQWGDLLAAIGDNPPPIPTPTPSSLNLSK